MALPDDGGHAAEPFVDTRAVHRHAGQSLPDLIPYDSALGGKTTFLYRREQQAYEPGWAAVSQAPRPAAVMAGVSEGSTVATATRLRAAGEGWAMGAAARGEYGHAYDDGNGSKVNFGYERESQWLGGRWGQGGTTQLTVGLARDVLDDVKLPNYGLDADRIDQGGARAVMETTKLPGWFNEAGATVNWAYAHLDVDNFTLRAPGAARVNAVGDHQTVRAAGWAARDDAASRTLFGVDLARQMHVAKRYGREYGPDAITAYWMPGVEVLRAGTWAERRVTWSDTTVTGGLRYDLVSMRAADVHNVPQTPSASYNYSPQQLFDRFYGPGLDNDALDHNVSGRLRVERPVAAGATVHADLARLLRSPDHGERFTANTGSAAMIEVGNPELEPEKHNKATLGGAATGGGFKQYGLGSPAGAWRIEAAGWHDHAEDLVTIDNARGQPGVATAGGGQVYRNVDAAISGLSADLQSMLAEQMGIRLNLSGQRGRNLTDGRPLHQMAPFEANLFLDVFGGDADFGWNAGSRLRAVAGKHSVDSNAGTGNGQDTAGPAGGFATLDLYAGMRFGDAVAVTAGVDNVFDKLYREHLKAVPHTSTRVMPNAPGRTLVLRGLVSF